MDNGTRSGRNCASSAARSGSQTGPRKRNSSAGRPIHHRPGKPSRPAGTAANVARTGQAREGVAATPAGPLPGGWSTADGPSPRSVVKRRLTTYVTGDDGQGGLDGCHGELRCGRHQPQVIPEPSNDASEPDLLEEGQHADREPCDGANQSDEQDGMGDDTRGAGQAGRRCATSSAAMKNISVYGS